MKLKHFLNHLKSNLTSFIGNQLFSHAMINPQAVMFIISESFEDNSLVLLNYMLNVCPEFHFYLLVEDGMIERYENMFSNNKRITVFSRQSNYVQSIRMQVSCKYVFYMNRRPFHTINIRKGQVVVNLWHGSGYKDTGSFAKGWRDGMDFDYVLVPGPIFIDTKAKFFNCKKERILPLGYPRYDELKRRPSEIINEYLYRLFNQKDPSQLVIWMPTFRTPIKDSLQGDESTIEYEFDLPLLSSELDVRLLNDLCNKDHINLLIKRHPHQKRYSCEDNSYSNIRFICNEDLQKNNISLYQLLNCTDALISDYSSISVDYLLLDKPIAFSLDDFEQYKHTRGFVFENPLEYMPGHHLYNIDDLKNFLLDISTNKDPYREARSKLMPLMHNPCDNYCERIWKTITNL